MLRVQQLLESLGEQDYQELSEHDLPHTRILMRKGRKNKEATKVVALCERHLPDAMGFLERCNELVASINTLVMRQRGSDSYRLPALDYLSGLLRRRQACWAALLFPLEQIPDWLPALLPGATHDHHHRCTMPVAWDYQADVLHLPDTDSTTAQPVAAWIRELCAPPPAKTADD